VFDLKFGLNLLSTQPTNHPSEHTQLVANIIRLERLSIKQKQSELKELRVDFGSHRLVNERTLLTDPNIFAAFSKSNPSLKTISLSNFGAVETNILSPIHPAHIEKLSLRAASFNSNLNPVKTQNSKLINGCKSFRNLVSLQLNSLMLRPLDKEFFHSFFQLKRLNLNESKVNLNEKTFAGLTNLNELSLSGCGIKSLKRNSFGSLVNLKSLNLSYNPIKCLDRRMFEGLNRLEELLLDRCRLKTIFQDQFDDLKMLSNLSLSHNVMMTLEMNCFRSLVNLKKINLVGCPLVNTENGCLNGLELLRVLILE
jgi:hypothetical protein